MGEASRRKAEINALKARVSIWRDSLMGEELVIAKVAERAYENIVIEREMTGACYLLAFFLKRFLLRNHGISVQVVVGYVNDGQWEGATSHAWLEYLGKKIDISLHKTTCESSQPKGDLLILDFPVKKGEVSYTYWKELPATAVRAYEKMSMESIELADTIAFKAREHQIITKYSMSDEGIDAYFCEAPSAANYEFLSGLMNEA